MSELSSLKQFVFALYIFAVLPSAVHKLQAMNSFFKYENVPLLSSVISIG